MAGEVQFSYQRGKTTYFVARNQTSGFIWSTSGGTSGAFEAFTSGNWANYAISCTEQGTSATYAGNWPTTMAAGVYGVIAKDQLGGTPTQLDTSIGAGDFQWGGSAVVPLSDTVTSGQFSQAAPIRMARSEAISGFMFKLVSSSDHVTNFTSGVVSGQISRDGAAFGALQSGTITEVGLGWFRCNLTSGDVNAKTIALLFTAAGISGGSSDQRDFSFVTQRVSGY